MSKLLLLKFKMRRIDIPVNEIGRHFQTFSVADEGVGVFVCGSTLSMNALFWKKTPYNAVYSRIDQLRS